MLAGGRGYYVLPVSNSEVTAAPAATPNLSLWPVDNGGLAAA